MTCVMISHWKARTESKPAKESTRPRKRRRASTSTVLTWQPLHTETVEAVNTANKAAHSLYCTSQTVSLHSGKQKTLGAPNPKYMVKTTLPHRQRECFKKRLVLTSRNTKRYLLGMEQPLGNIERQEMNNQSIAVQVERSDASNEHLPSYKNTTRRFNKT